MIERWFPCEEVSAASQKGWGSGNSEANLFTWFAMRPLAQAKAAVITSLLPWPEEPGEQRRLQALVRAAFPERDDPNGRDAAHDELVTELDKHYPDGASILDPFSGRAIIPHEAARLGVQAIGFDYSPVATLGGQLLADYPLRDWSNEPALPFFESRTDAQGLDLDTPTSPRLLKDVEIVLKLVGDRYEQTMDAFYPKVDGKRPWGYLWAVTLPCQECGNRFPLVGSLALRHPLPKKGDPGQSYSIVTDSTVGRFDVVVHDGPPTSKPTLTAVQGKRGKSAVCPFPDCQHAHPIEVHTRLMNAGLAEDRLLIVADLDAQFGKVFRLPTTAEMKAVEAASEALQGEPDFAPGLPAVPHERIPPGNNDTVRPSKYGYRTYGELCNDRQTLGLVWLCRSISEFRKECDTARISEEYATALTRYATAVLVRRLKFCTRGAILTLRKSISSNRVYAGHIFANEASLAFSYDYFESGCGDGPGTWRSVARDLPSTLSKLLDRRNGLRVRVERGSALSLPLRSESVDAVVTDPPYDGMIDYSDASDLFYVWLKRVLHSTDPAFGITAHPAGVQEKAQEIIVKRGGLTAGDHRTSEFYNSSLAAALQEARRVVRGEGVVTIVFGHNDPDVWRDLLLVIDNAGLVLTGAWPALTEKGGSSGSANIVTTMTLACRGAPVSRGIGRSVEVAAAVREEVRKRVPLWEQAGLALQDQQMAAYGPAMEIVGRYSRILNSRAEPEDAEKFLLIARQAVEDAADVRIDGLPLGTFDARTRFALSWVRQHGRGTAGAAQERWQQLTAQAVAGTDLDLGSLTVKAKGGVRFVQGTEFEPATDRDAPIVDVALALARAGNSLTSAAEILDASGRADDEYLWSAISELGRRLAEGDKDGAVYTWLTRNRKHIVNAAADIDAIRETEQRLFQQAGQQLSISDQGAQP